MGVSILVFLLSCILLDHQDWPLLFSYISFRYSSLQIESLFDDYTIQSAMESNTINLELPISQLNRALKSAVHAQSASLRLTKKDGNPILSLTISANTHSGTASRAAVSDPFSSTYDEEPLDIHARETTIVQDIPVRVLSALTVEGIHEPRVREPDVNIILPPLTQLKAISDRFTKLATSTSNTFGVRGNGPVPKLELSANMHGKLRLAIKTDALSLKSEWKGLDNPELDQSQIEEALEDHPTTLLRARGPEAYATVRIDGRDWGKVLSVGRLDGRVIACELPPNRDSE